MHVITVTNWKGGVGKTTTSVHMAAGLASGGLRVGLVDTDSQGHAGLMLRMPAENGLYTVMVDKPDVGDVVRYVPKDHYTPADHPAEGDLWLLPSGDKTDLIERQLADSDSFYFWEVLEAFTNLHGLDAVIIDTNANNGTFDGSIWLATDSFVYVTELNRLSIDGLQKSLQKLDRFKHPRRRFLQRDTRMIGVVPNKVRALTRLHRANLGALRNELGGLLWDAVPQSILWEEAMNEYENPQTMFTYAPTSNEAKIAMKTAARAAMAIREVQR